MTDTAQPETAAETEVAPILSAAEAFKTFEADAPDRPRDEKGKFVSTQADEPEEEIEAEGDEPEAESHDDEDEPEAAEEAQPEAIDLPTSWPAELAEEWQTLPAPLQEKIVQREAERETATNAK